MYRDCPEAIPLSEAMEAILAKTSQSGSRAAAAGRPKAKTAELASKTTKKGAVSKAQVSVAKLKGGVTKIKGGVAKASAKGEVPAKRARTAFIFFCSEKRPEVTARGLSFGEITKELASMWKALTPDERDPYEEMSNLDKLKLQSSSATTTSSSSSSSSSSTRKEVKVNKVSKGEAKSETSAKRPKSAYLFFCSEMREEIASQGLSFGEITKRLSVEWKELQPGQRLKYEVMAKSDQERYRLQLSQSK